MSSSVKWLDTKNNEQRLWLRKYLAKNYPGTFKAIIETPSIGDRMFVSEFKKNIDKYWGKPEERLQNVIKLRNAWHKKKSRSRVATLSIDVSPELLEQFTSLAKGITHAELLSQLIEAFNMEKGSIDLFETVTQKKEKRNDIDELQQEIAALRSELYQKNQELESANRELEVANKNSEKPAHQDVNEEEKTFSFEEKVQIAASKIKFE
ncbi:hypothetical protein [Vibrio sp. 1288]|uniref:hypothetical protein n=1 Tax=Vibrio sp. 1288 TaxID=3074550 RepID=UPI002966A9CC|nr:hypothetical protein [Vibrio sp. 1288]MDW3136310.1 hypothetical protein [Vibrio sp. 1288]